MNSNLNKDLNLEQINDITNTNTFNNKNPKNDNNNNPINQNMNENENDINQIEQNQDQNYINIIDNNNMNNNYNYNNNNDMNQNYNYDYNYNYQDVVMPDINDLICDQKQFIDDDYLLQLHQRLVQTRELRKISENGVKILNGRVRCLKDENQKTLNKIYRTGKKMDEKLLNMERKKSQSREKMERIKRLEYELNLLKNRNMNQKIDRDNGLINSRKKVLSENKIKGRISKKEKDEICNIKLMNELNEKNIKKNKIEVIRSQAAQKIQKKRMAEIEKKESIIKDLEQKINYEINKKNELEEEINKMLKEETETFERINKTNEMQKKIFADFEKILRDNSGVNNIYDNYYKNEIDLNSNENNNYEENEGNNKDNENNEIYE